MNENKNKRSSLKKFIESNPSFPFETVFGGLGTREYGTLKVFAWYVFNKKVENRGMIPTSITPADFIQKLENDEYGFASKYGTGAVNKAISDFQRVTGEHRIAKDQRQDPGRNFLYQFAVRLDDEGILENISRGDVVENYRRALEGGAPASAAAPKGTPPSAGKPSMDAGQTLTGSPATTPSEKKSQTGDSLGVGRGTAGKQTEQYKYTRPPEEEEPQRPEELETTDEQKKSQPSGEMAGERVAPRRPESARLGAEEAPSEAEVPTREGGEAPEAPETPEGEGMPEPQGPEAPPPETPEPYQRLVVPQEGEEGDAPTRMMEEHPSKRRLTGEPGTPPSGTKEKREKEGEGKEEDSEESQFERMGGQPMSGSPMAGRTRGGKKDRPAVIKIIRGGVIAGGCTAGGAWILGASASTEAATMDMVKITFESLF